MQDRQSDAGEGQRRGARDRLGLVHVYTGEGKGKTTAALGLALRASGQGLRAGILQFMKGNSRCGEHRFVQRYPAFTIIQPQHRPSFGRTRDEARVDAQRTLELASSLIAGGEYDLLVLDEAITALSRGLLDVEQVLALIHDKPSSLELVLTGRGAPPEVIEAADLATEMKKVKHPWDRGIKARRGVEF